MFSSNYTQGNIQTGLDAQMNWRRRGELPGEYSEEVLQRTEGVQKVEIVTRTMDSKHCHGRRGLGTVKRWW